MPRKKTTKDMTWSKGAWSKPFDPRRALSKPKARTNWREIAEASVEREKQWKHTCERLQGEVDNLKYWRELFNEGARKTSKLSATFERQGRHVKALLVAMIDRYVGVKLDTQQFTFQQAAQFATNEHGNLERVLNDIAQAVEAEFAQQAAQQMQAGPANGVSSDEQPR